MKLKFALVDTGRTAGGLEGWEVICEVTGQQVNVLRHVKIRIPSEMVKWIC